MKLNDLQTLAKRLRNKKRQGVESELKYLESHRQRLDYAAARRAGELQGSGAMESTCRHISVDSNAQVSSGVVWELKA